MNIECWCDWLDWVLCDVGIIGIDVGVIMRFVVVGIGIIVCKLKIEIFLFYMYIFKIINYIYYIIKRNIGLI